MFSDLAVAHGIPVRRWVPLVSFSLQAAMVATAFVYPLLRMEPLPAVPHPVLLPIISEAAPFHPTGEIAHGGGAPVTQPIIVHNYSSSIRGPITDSNDTAESSPPNIGVVGIGDRGGLPSSILNGYPPTVPVVATQPRNVRTSVMMEGNLIHKVEPQYPAVAQQLHIEGSVIIQAWISREGFIERAQVVSGHPLLVHAALEAVRQWRYRPYYLNHEPVEVETEITVNFVIHR
ncbi:MAG TPA: energy transducer TonB [Terriglobales bacterium]|nr:energy transducer TonB [Terriglobales bacterium]